MTRTVPFLLAGLLALAACGAKGPPTPPPGPDGQPRSSAIPVGADAPPSGEATRNPGAADRPFILDGLLN